MNCKTAYMITGIIALVTLLQVAINMIIYWNTGVPGENSNVSVGCILWLAPLLCAVFIPTEHFRKIINLGGRRSGFLAGSLACYVFLAFAGALLNTLIYYTFDRFIQTGGFSSGTLGGVTNLAEIFGWTANGILVAFFQQFALLFLALSAIHTLTAIQGKWYGWAADAAIAAFVALCTPIAALRPALLGFLDLIIFQSNALLQIAACVILGLIIYVLNKPIFARKAI